MKNVPLPFLVFLPRPSARFPVNDFVGCVAHTCTVACGKYGVPHTRTWIAKVGLCLASYSWSRKQHNNTSPIRGYVLTFRSGRKMGWRIDNATTSRNSLLYSLRKECDPCDSWKHIFTFVFIQSSILMKGICRAALNISYQSIVSPLIKFKARLIILRITITVSLAIYGVNGRISNFPSRISISGKWATYTSKLYDIHT